MELLHFIQENWQLITGTFGAVITFFVGKQIRKANERKADAEADSKHIENLDRIFKIQKQQVDDIVASFEAEKERIKRQLNDIVEELKKENESLRKLLLDKQHIIDEQTAVIDKYKRLLQEQKETIRKMSNSLNYYKKKYGKNEK